MSARHRLSTVLCGLAVCGSSGVCIAADETPDPEFLEYLGMWEETDEEWQLMDEIMVAENEERSDPAPEGKESTEAEDES